MKSILLAIFLSLFCLPAMAENVVIEMAQGLRFEPSQVTIQAGDTVTWKNVSSLQHTATAQKDLANDPSHVQLPQDAEPFNSGFVSPGASYKHTFDVPGTYQYFCIPHESSGMIGRIIVE